MAAIRNLLVTLVMAVTLTSWETSATLPPTIFYFVTVRDFMGAACVQSSSANDACPQSQSIQDAVAAGTFSGHPDFQRVFANHVSSATTGQYSAPFANGKLFPVATPGGTLKPVVLSTLAYDTTGIGKMQYCHGEEGYACDSGRTARSVFSEDSFSTWYQDSSTFNLRYGYRQDLKLVPNKGEYSFQSTSDSPHSFYDPVQQNGLGGWPLSKVEANISPKNTLKFWITTEIHASFQYRGGESFTFTGDDDVHVFINRRIAINLGGVHVKTSLTINLDDFATELGIQIGGIYEFDLFHAERQTSESNYGIETTLSEACNVVNSGFRTNGADVEQPIDWTTTGKTQNSDWTVIAGPGFGLFDPTNGVKAINLMPTGISNSVAYMFHTQKVNVGSGFSMSFNFKLTGQGHGFSVIMHNRPEGLQNLNGGMGPNLGIRGIENSFAFVFDSCPEFPATCKTQQVRLHYKADGDRLNSIESDTLKVFDDNVLQNWRDGQPHKVEIFYYAIPDWIEIYVDSSLRLVKKGFTSERVIGGRDAFVGFAASSSDVTSMNVRLDSVQLTAIKVVQRFSSLADNENLAVPKSFVANGRDPVSFTIKTRDACKNDIQFGGLANLAQGFLIAKLPTNTTSAASIHDGRRMLRSEERGLATLNNDTLTLLANVVDNGNGEYSLEFKTDVIANFSVHLAFGSGCVFDGTQFTAATQDCFFVNSDNAAVSVPFVTNAPTAFAPANTLPTSVLAGVGVGGGSIILIGSILVAAGIKSRNQWRKDKRFIEAGRLAALERDMKYVGDVELDSLQQRLQKTVEELHLLRSRKDKDDDNSALIQKLLTDKGELQEIVRRLKAQKMGLDPDAELTYGQHMSIMTANVRKSFAPSRVSQRMSRVISWRPDMRTSSSFGAESLESATAVVNRMRMSVSNGFSKMYSTAMPAEASKRESNSVLGTKEEVSTINPLFVRLQQDPLPGRQTALSSDSTHSATSKSSYTSPLARSSAATATPLLPAMKPSNGTLGSTAPRVPPRTDIGTLGSSTPRVPPRTDLGTLGYSAPRVPVRADAGTAGSAAPYGQPRPAFGSMESTGSKANSSTFGSKPPPVKPRPDLIGGSSGSASSRRPLYPPRIDEHV